MSQLINLFMTPYTQWTQIEAVSFIMLLAPVYAIVVYLAYRIKKECLG